MGNKLTVEYWCSASQHQVIIPCWLPKVLSWLRKKFPLSQLYTYCKIYINNYKYLSVGTLAMTGQFSQLYFIVHRAKFNCLNWIFPSIWSQRCNKYLYLLTLFLCLYCKLWNLTLSLWVYNPYTPILGHKSMQKKKIGP